MGLFKKKEKANNQSNVNDDKIKVDTSTITTMVGVDTVVEGNLITKSSVRINGTVNGHVKADGVVVLTKTGVIEGTVEAESIIVAGVVKGNMSIRDKVNVEASGQIYGEIITKKFVIDEESIFQGNCVMNRDGKVIPVPDYLTEAEKKKQEETNQKIEEEVKKRLEEEKKKLEKECKKDDKKEDVESEEEDSDTEDKDSEDAKADEKDSKEESKEAEGESDTDDSNKDDSKEESDDKKADDKEAEDKPSDNDEKADDTIIIADINEVEAVEDIPASDGNTEKKKRRGYLKTSKSLSVEIQEE